jgi:exopolysaccharide biosynthesis polyprenyl glycosylphosphotransferase
MKKPEIILRLLRIPLDYLSVLGAFLIAYYLRAHPDVVPFVDLESPLLLPWQDFFWFAIQAATLICFIFSWEKMYTLTKSYRFRKELKRMLMLMGAGFTVIILYFFVVGVQFFSRFILGSAFVLAIVFMLSHRFVLRLIQQMLWKKGIGRRRVLFLGKGKVMGELVGLWHEDPAFELVGLLVNGQWSVVGGLKKLGDPEDLEKVVEKYEIDEVVQVSHLPDSADFVEYCQLNHIEYRFVPDMLEVQRTNTEVEFITNIPLITLRSSAIDWWARVIKRIVDILGSSIGLILLSPFLLLIALGIKISDPGPVFYKSKRISKNKSFYMWKFRTMIVNADKLKKELMEKNRREGPLFKIQNDPRITRFGRFLRKTTLDELPQLWNVLKGDLSLVGPRAHLPEEIAQYEKHHRKVLAVKAGVTGLAQVSGRSQLDFEKEVKLDVYYLENWSLWMDMKIVLKTFTVLLEGE